MRTIVSSEIDNHIQSSKLLIYFLKGKFEKQTKLAAVKMDNQEEHPGINMSIDTNTPSINQEHFIQVFEET